MCDSICNRTTYTRDGTQIGYRANALNEYTALSNATENLCYDPGPAVSGTFRPRKPPRPGMVRSTREVLAPSKGSWHRLPLKGS